MGLGTLPTTPEDFDGSDQRELPSRWPRPSILSGCLVRNGSRCGLACFARTSSRKVKQLGPSTAKGPAICPLLHNL